MELSVFPKAVTPESLAPTFADGWRAWFVDGGHDFATGLTTNPAWFLRHADDPPFRLEAAGLDAARLKEWLVQEAGPEVAKAVLRCYRPRTEHQTVVGSLLVPGH